MHDLDDVDALFELYRSNGDQLYGEAISQSEHARQCAALATSHDAPEELVIAALFHDVGHLLNFPDEIGEADDDHEAKGARALAHLFGPDVAQSVALHVSAKRWLCAKEPAYYEALSDASKTSLRTQGGVLSEEECRRFEAHPGFDAALQLRAWDDQAKVRGLEVPGIESYEALVRSAALTWQRVRREH